MPKNLDITLEKSGRYEYKITESTDISITVNKALDCEVVIEYENDLIINKNVNLLENSELRLLNINNTVNMKSNDTFNLVDDARLKIGYYELNDNRVELNSFVNLLSENSEAEVMTTSISDSDKKYHIECIHHVGHTKSLMKNFEISNEHANYEITASGIIKKNARKANSVQHTRILTTSDNQKSKVIPLLLIDENDVVASHANSLGQMNEDELYYLESRGLDRKQATGLLTLSYLLPIKDIVDSQETKDRLDKMIRDKVGL